MKDNITKEMAIEALNLLQNGIMKGNELSLAISYLDQSGDVSPFEDKLNELDINYDSEFQNCLLMIFSEYPFNFEHLSNKIFSRIIKSDWVGVLYILDYSLCIGINPVLSMQEINLIKKFDRELKLSRPNDDIFSKKMHMIGYPEF
jgi:hypothetical protein